jgi:hypothetical protein
MRTLRQENGAVALEIVRRHCRCRQCQERRWRVVRGDQDGVDLQCRFCGRFVEVKGVFCGNRLRSWPRKRIPSGSCAVRERQHLQGYKVDLYVTLWDQAGGYIVRAVVAESQPAGFIVPRPILTGARAGYVLSDFVLSLLPRKSFPIIAEGNGRRRIQKRLDGGRTLRRDRNLARRRSARMQQPNHQLVLLSSDGGESPGERCRKSDS